MQTKLKEWVLTDDEEGRPAMKPLKGGGWVKKLDVDKLHPESITTDAEHQAAKGQLEVLMNLCLDYEGETLPQASPWIPVSERLPEEGQLILISGIAESGDRVTTTVWYVESVGLISNVTHWMQIPKIEGEQ